MIEIDDFKRVLRAIKNPYALNILVFKGIPLIVGIILKKSRDRPSDIDSP